MERHRTLPGFHTPSPFQREGWGGGGRASPQAWCARLLRLGPLPLGLLPVSAWSQMQSALEAYGTEAESLLNVSWVMFVGGTLILLLVVVLTVYAMVAQPQRRRWLSSATTIVMLGIVFPVVTLSALLVYELVLSREFTAARETPLLIEVTGEQWWWRVRYLDEAGVPQFETANEVHIPVGRPVEFRLRAADVIHSFWVPKLGGKIDMIPGRVNFLRVEAQTPGIFRGQCAEYCGGPHAMMAFYVVVSPAEVYERWHEAQRAPAREPADAFLAAGQELFLTRGCLVCHTIRGTQALASNGPDLTHVGSRLSLAAGNFPNNAGTLGGWIADAQHLKPGNYMPPFNRFLGVELRALAEYLESLK